MGPVLSYRENGQSSYVSPFSTCVLLTIFTTSGGLDTIISSMGLYCNSEAFDAHEAWTSLYCEALDFRAHSLVPKCRLVCPSMTPSSLQPRHLGCPLTFRQCFYMPLEVSELVRFSEQANFSALFSGAQGDHVTSFARWIHCYVSCFIKHIPLSISLTSINGEQAPIELLQRGLVTKIVIQEPDAGNPSRSCSRPWVSDTFAWTGLVNAINLALTDQKRSIFG